MTSTRAFTAALAFGAMTFFAGCGGTQDGPSGGGTLRVMLKDSPYSDAKAVLVTFSDVSVHRDDPANDKWTKVAFSGGAAGRTCDLKKLQTAQDVLGVGALDTGHYTQVRLVVSSATLYFDNASTGDPCAASIATPAGASASVEVPSGELKLNRGFDVSSTETTTMLLDFDGDRSLHQTGNGRYMMSPVITVVSVN